MSKHSDAAERMERLTRRMLGGAASRQRMLHAFQPSDRGYGELVREVRDMTAWAQRAHRQAIRLRKRVV